MTCAQRLVALLEAYGIDTAMGQALAADWLTDAANPLIIELDAAAWNASL